MAKTSIISQIATRAKAIRRKSPGKKWQTCIKEASAELRGTGKKKKRTGRQTVRRKKVGTTATATRQTGSSNRKRDLQRKAKRPGKRKSKTGRVYTERRKNRSDKPKSLTGIGKAIGLVKSHYNDNLAKALLAREKAKNLKQHKAAMKRIKLYRGKLKSV